jgi:hypothetical protein
MNRLLRYQLLVKTPTTPVDWDKNKKGAPKCSFSLNLFFSHKSIPFPINNQQLAIPNSKPTALNPPESNLKRQVLSSLRRTSHP